MNYIKIVEGVAGLIPKKVKLTLFNSALNKNIGEYKVWEDKLPAIFNKPTLLEIEGKVWRIIRVHILREGSYLFSKKIEIYVESPDLFDPGDRFLIPTKSYSGFFIKENRSEEQIKLLIEADAWRQIELLSLQQLNLIRNEITEVESILSSASDMDSLLGYHTLHRRKNIFDATLSIPISDFKSVIPVKKEGVVEVLGYGIVENSFLFQTDWYSYYGICIEDVIKELAVSSFECIDDEFAGVLNAFNLVLADWCNAKIIMETALDKEEQEANGF